MARPRNRWGHDWVDDVLMNAVEGEYVRWSLALPGKARHPDPHEDNGLPAGWVIVSRFADYRLVTDLLLVRRPEGDWVVMDHHRGARLTGIDMVFATLQEVFEHNRNRPNPNPQSARFTVWLQKVFVRCYDIDDPKDAAEMTLVSLGTEATAVPVVFAAPSAVLV